MNDAAPLLDLRPDHWDIVRDLLQRHVPDREVLAFGSRATWKAKQYSDLDLAILGDKPLPLNASAALAEAFSESDLPFKVDLIDWARIDESFRKVVRHDGLTVQTPATEPGPAGDVECHRKLDAGRSASRTAGPERTMRDAAVEGLDLPEHSRQGIEQEHVVLSREASSTGERHLFSQLGDHAHVVMGQSPAGATCNTTGEGMPLLNGPTQFGSHHPIPVQFTVDPRRRATIGDLLFCVRGSTTGRMNWADRDYAIGRGVAAIRHRSGPRFQPLVRAVVEHGLPKLLAQATGSTFPNVSADLILTIEWPHFGLPEQRAIAGFLGALDDKIELNRRMNETLEAMARAIFKDWFIDFGPTRAKAEGRNPYLAPEVWSLFPDALDEEGKPVGWVRIPLNEIADFLNGLALQKFPASDDEKSLPVIKIAELRGGITSKSNRASLDVPHNYIVKDGDFLFSWSGSLLAKFWTDGDGALNQHLFKVTSAKFPPWFFSQWVYHYLEEFQAIASSKATTMGHIQRRHLKDAIATCPPDDALELLGQWISPIIERTIRNDLESRTLAEARNFLLPKLMSGEIRLRDAENAVKAAL